MKKDNRLTFQKTNHFYSSSIKKKEKIWSLFFRVGMMTVSTILKKTFNLEHLTRIFLRLIFIGLEISLPSYKLVNDFKNYLSGS